MIGSTASSVLVYLTMEGLPKVQEIAEAQSKQDLPMTKQEVYGLNLGLTEEMATEISSVLTEIYVSNSIQIPFEDDGEWVDYHFEDHSLAFESYILQIECECGSVDEINPMASGKNTIGDLSCVECGKKIEISLGDSPGE